MRKSICIVASEPGFLGGVSLFQNNFLDYLKSIKFEADITWVYQGKTNRAYSKNGIICREIKTPGFYPLNEFFYNLKLASYFRKNNFDIISINGTGGFWTIFSRKNKERRIVSTYHGTTYYFFKNHMKRFPILKRIIFSPMLLFGFVIERPQAKKSDRIIAVSNKVRDEIAALYGQREKIKVVRTGVDTETFRPRDREKARKELHLEKGIIYGMYVGRGGWWTKGLDRAIKLSEEIEKIIPDYKLMVIGADRKKVKGLVKRKSVILLPEIPREKMAKYYDASDIFLCLSRYEGGAPTLVASEAMASGCMLVASKDAKQEIIEDGKNGIIIGENYEKEARKIADIIENRGKMERIIKNSIKTAKGLSLEKWGEKYLNALLN